MFEVGPTAAVRTSTKFSDVPTDEGSCQAPSDDNPGRPPSTFGEPRRSLSTPEKPRTSDTGKGATSTSEHPP